MGIGSHKVFKTAVKDISQDLSNLDESGSEVSHFIPEPRKFADKETLAKGKSKGDQRPNQQSDFSSSRSREG